MIGWAIGAFAVAAAGGVAMLLLAAKERKVPMGLALLHGALAATGLVLLGIPVVQGAAGGLATASLVVFVLAALGGFVLFAQYVRTGAFPVSLGVVHGLAAVVAFGLLVFWVVA